MSKLIVEMEMPKFCIWSDDKNEPHRCPLLNEDDDCALQDLDIWMGWNEQYAHCPIKGVLPDEHGDLIDRDALKKEISVLQDTSIIPWVKAREYAEIAKSSTLNIIDDQHAVIEAERKDDEQIH